MSEAHGDSNARLIDVFEMVMARLDTLGGQMTDVQRQLELQQTCQRHSDSVRPVGIPFSGMALLGDPVKITSHVEFDQEGRFDVGPPFMTFLVIEIDQAFSLVCEDSLKVEEGWTSEWESAARAAWGGPKYEEVIPKLDAYWQLHNRRHTRGLLCSEVGMTSLHKFVQDEIFEIRARIKHPKIRALGDRGFIVETSDIKELYLITKSLSHACGLTPTSMTIHCCHDWFEALAKSCLYVVRGAGKAAWAALDESVRHRVQRGEEPFFTEERLALSLC